MNPDFLKMERFGIINRKNTGRLLNLILKKKMVVNYDSMEFPISDVESGKIINFISSRYDGFLRRQRPGSYPIGLQLEPTTDCQLSCPLCPRHLVKNNSNELHMDWDNYCRLMDELGPKLFAIAFWQWGEPLLNPKLPEMIKLANNYGIVTFLSTNGQADPQSIDLEGLIKSGLDMLIISMDGTSQSTYEKFREGACLDKLKRFTETLIETKKKLGVELPIINIRIIATSENEKDINAVRKYAHDVGADCFSIKSVSLYYDANPENNSLPTDKRYRSFQYKGPKEAEEYRNMPNMCLKPWTWPTLRFDGTLLMCECDHAMKYPLGNVFEEDSFLKVWQSEDAQGIRAHFPADGNTDLDYCQRCRYKIGDAIREVDYIISD